MSDPALERDGLRVATVKSRALRRRVDASFWVPRAERVNTLLILLHGVWGSHWVWPQKGAAHHTARRMIDAGEIEPMVLAMPSDGLHRDGSGYLSWPGEGDVERWIVEEVPALARLAAPALAPDASIAIAGLSMGGYGALRLGAKYPERFGAIAAHSAITGIADFAGFVEEPLLEYRNCAPPEELEAAFWLQRNRAVLPPLRFDCGRDDPLIHSNRCLRDTLLREGIAHTWAEHAGGHEWAYWQQHLPDTLHHVHQHCQRKDTP